ncbi:hypothetical protein HYT57_00500 [Candidatus Woesearchaeota archaeon]|nr:hypothetical protein [Candidatus Woesearchaeota archaeon]
MLEDVEVQMKGEEPYPPHEVTDFLNFIDFEESLEQRLRQLFNEDKISEACEIVLRNVHRLINFTRSFIPDIALVELNAQSRCLWPSGSGSYYSDQDLRIKDNFREKRWKNELEVLEAANPRRVKRLWEESKAGFEKRYHRQFRDRRDLAVMFGIASKRRDLEKTIEELREVLPTRERFNELAEQEPNSGWEESRKLWEDYVISGCVQSCAESLINLAKDMIHPLKLSKQSHYTKREDEDWKEVEEDRNLIDYGLYGHGVEFPVKRKTIHPNLAMHFSSLFVEHKKGILSFSRTVNLLYPDHAKEAGMEDRRVYVSSFPEEISEIIYATLKSRYENKKPGDEASRFMGWYAVEILKRWEATAVDHDRLFDYHEPNFLDKRFMSVFWAIREGKPYDQYSKEHFHRRLPGVLRAMIEDGVITNDQIKPSLKEKYLTPDEVLTAQSSRELPASESPLVSLSMDRSPTAIVTSSEAMRLLSISEDNKLPVPLQNDLSQLKDILDKSKNYFALFSGDHTLFISGEEYFPDGSQKIGDVHRITLLPEGVDPKEGSVISISGRRFNITRQASYKTERDLENALSDAEVDAAPLSAYTVIVDIPPEEFRKTYFKDFMAHVCLHRHHIGLDGLLNDLNQIGKLKTTGFRISTGPTGRSSLSTFELNGRFGFQIKEEDNPMPGEVPFIAKTLIGYISDVGLPFHREISLDEEGRAVIRKKIEDREFSTNHLSEIIKSLQGDGLPQVLSYVLSDNRYHLWNFGESQRPCETCGGRYIGGKIYRPDLSEQWINGVNAEDLHALAIHPLTFRSRFDNLRKIHRLLEEAEEHTPSFIEYPEIMPEFTTFAQTYQEYLHAEGEDYAFWEGTRGGIREEEEELEDNPELKRLKDEETELCRRKYEAMDTAWNSAVKLQERYDQLSGKGTRKDAKVDEIVLHWSNQLMIFGIYQASAPKLLTANIRNYEGSELESTRLNLYIS